jgi:hypothetical protein
MTIPSSGREFSSRKKFVRLFIHCNLIQDHHEEVGTTGVATAGISHKHLPVGRIAANAI